MTTRLAPLIDLTHFGERVLPLLKQAGLRL
jgi:hypothetical protein